MKFPIKFKIVALGAILSVLVTTIALVFSNYEYRRRGKNNQINDMNSWLESVNTAINDPIEGYNYLNATFDTREYILKCYETASDVAPEEMSKEEKRLFYKDRFNWLYAIEGLSMHHMTPEEISFRETYQDLLFLLSEGKEATKGNLAYIAFVDDNNTLFYMGDCYSYKESPKNTMNFPGSRYYNFPGEFVQNGLFYNVNFDGTMNRALDIKKNDELVAYLFIQYDFNAVEEDANSLIKTEIIALSIASVAMIIAYALGAHFLLTRNVAKLTKSATEFTEGINKGKQLKVKDPKIKSRDEMRTLSKSFVSLEEGIINYIDILQKETQEKERMNVELSVANSIQLSALPKKNYDDKNVRIRASIKSAKEVGGDFYDYFYLDENRLVIVISDVSGKGIPAALFMMKSKELIKSSILSHPNLLDAVTEVNTTLTSNDKESLFVTSFMGIIDFKKNNITYVNAGHEKPYIITPNGIIKLDGESNFVMGGESDFVYKQESHAFNKGDSIFLFTDGLNESINDKREEFSYERIEKTLANNLALSSDEIISKMEEELSKFVKNEEQFDDVTLLVIKNKDHKLHLSYDKKDYSIISNIVDSFNDNFDYLDEESRSKVGIVIDELVNNLVSYEKREDLKIQIDFNLNKNNLEIVVTSNGEDYDPFKEHKEKYFEEFHPDIEEGGFGLSIIKDLAKEYNYQYLNNNSIITIIIKMKE